MTGFRLRKRHRLRQKEIAALAERIDEVLGTRSFSAEDVVDMAEGPEYDVVFVNGKVLAFLPGGVPFLTVRGILRYGASKRHITVDMGAVRFVCNGADIMGPGIVDSDSAIAVGDLVWIRDVQNRKPLAIGRALISGESMARKERGKAVESIHHVGDRLWLVDETKPTEELATD